jgi:hypothetical protein
MRLGGLRRGGHTQPAGSHPERRSSRERVAVLTISGARLTIGGFSTEPGGTERVLVVVHEAANGNVELFTGADINLDWAWMQKALPDSHSIDPKECKGEGTRMSPLTLRRSGDLSAESGTRQ